MMIKRFLFFLNNAFFTHTDGDGGDGNASNVTKSGDTPSNIDDATRDIITLVNGNHI